MSTDTSITETAAVEPDSAETGETAGGDAAAPEASDNGVEGDSEVVEDQDDDDAGDGDGPGREAAKYRRRLREAETERDQLAERIGSLQRAEVERLAAVDGLRPAALWASGAELDDLLGDDGTVDAAKVSEAIGAAREQLGIPKPAHNTKEGRTVRRPGKPSGREAMVSAVMGRGD